MGNHMLLIVSIGIILMGFAISFDNRNPVLCTTLKVKFLCKEGSIIHHLFPNKESELYPHSLLLILPLFIALIMFPVVLIVYVFYWTTDILIIRNFIQSEISFAIGGFTLFAYFLYPIFLIIFNKIISSREKALSEEKYEALQSAYDSYYKKILKKSRRDNNINRL